MSKVKFEDAVASILERDTTYRSDAYFFLRDALDHTVRTQRGDELAEHSHVTGRELLEGMRDYALEEFGSMSLPVLESWGIESGRDIGRMVFNLIEEEAFGKSEEDHPKDFEGWLSFEEAFLDPFRPSRPVLCRPAIQPPTEPLDPLAIDNKPATTNET